MIAPHCCVCVLSKCGYPGVCPRLQHMQGRLTNDEPYKNLQVPGSPCIQLEKVTDERLPAGGRAGVQKLLGLAQRRPIGVQNVPRPMRDSRFSMEQFSGTWLSIV